MDLPEKIQEMALFLRYHLRWIQTALPSYLLTQLVLENSGYLQPHSLHGKL
jgi:hypothetical protein